MKLGKIYKSIPRKYHHPFVLSLSKYTNSLPLLFLCMMFNQIKSAEIGLVNPLYSLVICGKDKGLSMLHGLGYIGAQFTYVYGRTFIDFAMKIRSVKNDIMLFVVSKTKQKKDFILYCKTYVAMIDKDLQKIRDDLVQDEHFVRDKLYKFFNISELQIELLNKLISEKYDIIKCYLGEKNKQYKAADQDVEFSSETKRFLEQQNINPLNINVRYCDQTALSYRVEGQVKALAQLFASFPDCNWPLREPRYKFECICPTITLYPSYKKDSDLNQQAYIEHELGHIISQHSTSQVIIFAGISNYAKVESDVLDKNKYWDNLMIEHERQAEVLHTSAHSAAIMRQHRRGEYYRNTLYLKHYKQLADIDELYKLKQKINDRVLQLENNGAIKS